LPSCAWIGLQCSPSAIAFFVSALHGLLPLAPS